MVFQLLGALLATLVGFAGFAITDYARGLGDPYATIVWYVGVLLLLGGLFGACLALFRPRHKP